MSFTPIIPYSGFDGFGYVRSNLDAQRANRDAAAPAAEAVELQHFEDAIADVGSARALIDDPRLLAVALGAFGLGKALPSRAFLSDVLTQSPEDPGSAAARTGDARWIELARTFGFSRSTAGKVGEAGFGADIVARYRIQKFEQAVGAAAPDMRRALAFERTATRLAAAGLGEADGWAEALSHGQTRRVLARALGLPLSFDALPLDAQTEMVADEVETITGSRKIDALAEVAPRDALLRRFFEAERRAAPAGVGAPSLLSLREGEAGWRMLQGSLDAQQAAFARADRDNPDLRYFARAVGAAVTPRDLAEDETLLRVALTAFGLGDARPTADFVVAMLRSDPGDPGSAVNQQDDPRWRAMAAAFGYGSGAGPQVRRFGFAEQIADKHRIASFEAAAGAADDNLRLALVFDRAMAALADEGLDDDEGWRRALGHPSLAHVMRQALDLPAGFANLDMDARVRTAREAARAVAGADGIDAFADGRLRDELIGVFFEGADDERPAGGLGQPVVPLGGLPGWRYLQSTLETQRDSYAASAAVAREIDYFRENVGRIETAEQLVADRRLLTVALTAFGLGEEVDKRAFIEKALAEGTERRDALAIRMVDPRYRELSAAFGFGDGRGAQTGVDGFADAIIARYETRAFELAVGEVDNAMRLSLNFDRAAALLGGSTLSDEAGWFRLLGDLPMRTVLEGALGLPKEFAQIDIDRQREIVAGKITSLFGSSSISALGDAEVRDGLIRRFLLREQTAQGPSATTPGFAALSLLRAGGSGGSSTVNLLL